MQEHLLGKITSWVMLPSYVNLNLKEDIVPETITFNMFISDLSKDRQE